MHKGCILYKAEGKAIPEKALIHIASKLITVSGVAAISTVTGNKELFVDQIDKENPKDLLTSIREYQTEQDFINNKAYIFFGDFPAGYTDDDLQPFELIKGDAGEYTLVAMIEGEFPGFATDNKNESVAFKVKNDYLIDKLGPFWGKSGGDIDKFMEMMNTDNILKKDLHAQTSRGQITLIASNGRSFNFGGNPLKKTFPWGWMSQSYGYEEVAEAPVVQKSRSRTLSALGSMVGKKTSVPIIASTEPINQGKTIADLNKKDAEAVDSHDISAMMAAATADENGRFDLPSEVRFVPAELEGKVNGFRFPKASLKVGKDLIAWYKNTNNGYVPDKDKGDSIDWRLRPGIRDRNAAKLEKAEANTAKAVVSQPAPIIAAQADATKIQGCRTLVKSYLDSGSNEISDPKLLLERDGKLPTFAKVMNLKGFKPEDMFRWSHTKRVELCTKFPELAATAWRDTNSMLLATLKGEPKVEEDDRGNLIPGEEEEVIEDNPGGVPSPAAAPKPAAKKTSAWEDDGIPVRKRA